MGGPRKAAVTRWPRYWLGRYWLRHGYCPACNSSPPEPMCTVCSGDQRYGNEADSAKRELWRWRWDALARPGARPRRGHPSTAAWLLWCAVWMTAALAVAGAVIVAVHAVYVALA